MQELRPEESSQGYPLMRRVFIGLVIAAAVAVGLFAATHKPIYGPCTITADGKVCPLIGYK